MTSLCFWSWTLSLRRRLNKLPCYLNCWISVNVQDTYSAISGFVPTGPINETICVVRSCNPLNTSYITTLINADEKREEPECTLILWSGCFISPKSARVLASSKLSSTENVVSRIGGLGLVGVWGSTMVANQEAQRAKKSQTLPDMRFPREKHELSNRTAQPNLKTSELPRVSELKTQNSQYWQSRTFYYVTVTQA